LNAAVELVKINHLLGVFVAADFLVSLSSDDPLEFGYFSIFDTKVKVPSLIQGIRYAGLQVGVYGAPDKSAPIFESNTVDALLRGGMVTFTNHSMNELI
jgi:hypothetical protein